MKLRDSEFFENSENRDATGEIKTLGTTQSLVG
jgi:hypothetical protein